MIYITEPVVEKAPLAVAKQDVPVVVVLPVMFGPNIRGTARGFRSIFGDTETNWNEGGLSTSTEVPDTAGVNPVFGHEVGIARRDLQLSANASNDIFGKSTTVQPSALRLIPCIKI